MKEQSRDDKVRENPPEGSSFRSILTFLGSAKMAVIILVILAFFSAVGTLIPQEQPREYYMGHYGDVWGGIFVMFGLYNLYYTPWFIVLLFLVALNLVISNVRRFQRLSHGDRELKIATGPQSFTKSPRSVLFKTEAGLEKVLVRVEEALRSLHYFVRKEPKGTEIYYFAEKGKIRRWGSLLTHTGILLVFLGVIYGHLPGMGYKGVVTLSPGSADPSVPGTAEVREAGFSIRLADTGSRVDERGRPLDFYSKVEVIENGRVMKEKVIRVNDPLVYKDVKFYQSNYGVAGFYLEVKEKGGSTYRIPIYLTPDGQPEVTLPIQVGKTSLFLFLHNFDPNGSPEKSAHPGGSMNMPDPAANIFIYENFSMEKTNKFTTKGWVSKHEALQYGNFTVEMGDQIKYSGLQYRKDPGVPLVWFGFLVTTAGLFLAFYVSHKDIRILLLPESGGEGVNLYVQTYSQMEEGFEREIAALEKSLKEI